MLPPYASRATEFTEKAAQLHARYERMGYIRLLAFVGLLVLVILAWRETPWWSGLLITLGGIAGFARLVRQHSKVQTSARHHEQLAAVNEIEAAATQGDHSRLATGEVFLDATHPYSYDMDIFGPHSLFQMLNRANTSGGQQLLAQWLQTAADTPEIVARQAAARELAQQLEWDHEFRAHGRALQEEAGQIDRLYAWLTTPYVVMDKPVRKLALWLAPLLFVIAMVLWVTVLPWFIAFLLLIPAALWLRNCLDEVQALHQQTGRAAKTLRSYAQLIAQVEQGEFEAPRLKKLQAVFLTEKGTASQAVRKLAYRLSQLDVRYNAFVFLLEFSVVWDMQQAYLLDRWKARYREQLPQWFAALAELEAIASLGNLHRNQPDWCFAIIQEERRLIATALGHPLLPNDTRVTNELDMPTQGFMHLLTGSNMAGKSTWLRSVGTNIVLALAGAPSCARSLRLPQVQVYTSMRTQDALHESTSSFYAELKRLKFIIGAVEDPSRTNGRPVFFLLDEILKGTNSRDRHTGAKALIRQLVASRGAGIIATHDLELGALEAEADGRIENWAIEVDIRDGKLFFDYQLKRGVSQSFNATILMREMGIKI